MSALPIAKDISGSKHGKSVDGHRTIKVRLGEVGSSTKYGSNWKNGVPSKKGQGRRGLELSRYHTSEQIVSWTSRRGDPRGHFLNTKWWLARKLIHIPPAIPTSDATCGIMPGMLLATSAIVIK